MKNLITIFAFIIFGIIFPNEIKATDKIIHQDSLWVNGACSMCKDRIEKAAKKSGVEKAIRNKNTHILVVFYDESKTNLDAIEKAEAKVGHDTKNYKAKDEVYNKLPSCCKYRE